MRTMDTHGPPKVLLCAFNVVCKGMSKPPSQHLASTSSQDIETVKNESCLKLAVCNAGEKKRKKKRNGRKKKKHSPACCAFPVVHVLGTSKQLCYGRQSMAKTSALYGSSQKSIALQGLKSTQLLWQKPVMQATPLQRYRLRFRQARKFAVSIQPGFAEASRRLLLQSLFLFFLAIINCAFQQIFSLLARQHNDPCLQADRSIYRGSPWTYFCALHFPQPPQCTQSKSAGYSRPQAHSCVYIYLSIYKHFGTIFGQVNVYTLSRTLTFQIPGHSHMKCYTLPFLHIHRKGLYSVTLDVQKMRDGGPHTTKQAV